MQNKIEVDVSEISDMRYEDYINLISRILSENTPVNINSLHVDYRDFNLAAASVVLTLSKHNAMLEKRIIELENNFKKEK